MKRIPSFLALAAALAIGGSFATTQAATEASDSHASSHAQDAKPSDGAYTQGEVRRIDKGAGKITLKHGAIGNLGMPPMSMVFRAAKPAMLDRVKEGDKVRFKADRVQGVLTVTELKTERGKGDDDAFGKPADPKKAKQTIAVDMADTMRFTPSRIEVKRGETVRFVAKNTGKLKHEMVLGTRRELDEHAALMLRFPEMEHDEPNMLELKPGQSGEMGWQFTQPGEFYYGCLEPGHYEAGMVGKVIVR